MSGFIIESSAHCKHCDAELIEINNHTRSNTYLGYIAHENEVNNIIIQNNIVFCDQCHRVLGLRCIENNNVVLFANFIAFSSIFQINE